MEGAENKDWELTLGSSKMKNPGKLVKKDFSGVRMKAQVEWLDERRVGEAVMRMNIRRLFEGIMYKGKLGNRVGSYTGDMG